MQDDGTAPAEEKLTVKTLPWRPLRFAWIHTYDICGWGAAGGILASSILIASVFVASLTQGLGRDGFFTAILLFIVCLVCGAVVGACLGIIIGLLTAFPALCMVPFFNKGALFPEKVLHRAFKGGVRDSLRGLVIFAVTAAACVALYGWLALPTSLAHQEMGPRTLAGFLGGAVLGGIIGGCRGALFDAAQERRSQIDSGNSGGSLE